MDSLFEKALEWYQSGSLGKREAACELFPEEKLKKESESFLKKKNKEALEARNIQLQNILEKCKKQFPIGTPMWNNDGTDWCPNILISEPYIAETKYSVPDGVYNYGYTGKKKSVFAKTIRMKTTRNEPLDGDCKYSTINLEICLARMESNKEWAHRDHIIDLKEFYETKNEEKAAKVKWLKENIERDQKTLDVLKDELAELEAYKPEGLSKELINEIVKKYA